MGYNSVFIKPIDSPSGEFRFEQLFGFDRSRYLRIEINSNNGDPQANYMIEDKFYIRHTTIIKWGDNDTLWVYSGDIGTFYWKYENNKWNKYHADVTSIDMAPKVIQDRLKLIS